MVELPDDFVENYVMVPCPVGKRAFVIAIDVSIVIIYRYIFLYILWYGHLNVIEINH